MVQSLLTSPSPTLSSFHHTHTHTHRERERERNAGSALPLFLAYTELLSDYVKQKCVRKRADLNRRLISMCLLIRLLSVSYHWDQRWSPTDSNTSSTPDTCGKNRPQSQSIRQAPV